MSHDLLQDIVARYLKAADELAKAKVEYSIQWQIIRPKLNSDLAATHATIDKTKDRITTLTAKMKAIGIEMENEVLGAESH